MPVAARFHDLRDRLLSDVDRFRAEPVRLSFLKGGAADPDRPAVEIEAILTVETGADTKPTGGAAKDWNSRFSAQASALHVNRAGRPGLVIRKGDRVRALARLGQPWYEVLSVDDRGEPRLVVHLGEL